jgi:hypothetical protein
MSKRGSYLGGHTIVPRSWFSKGVQTFKKKHKTPEERLQEEEQQWKNVQEMQLRKRARAAQRKAARKETMREVKRRHADKTLLHADDQTIEEFRTARRRSKP